MSTLKFITIKLQFFVFIQFPSIPVKNNVTLFRLSRYDIFADLISRPKIIDEQNQIKANIATEKKGKN